MAQRRDAPFQPSLFGEHTIGFDPAFTRLRRIELDAASWVDWLPEWVEGADVLFEQVRSSQSWAQRTRQMHVGPVLEPRLTALWREGDGELLPILEDMRVALSHRYEVHLDSVGFNLYRDGRDGVAWHGDHIRSDIAEPIVALVSLGEPRRFLLRRRGGGPSMPFALGRGDLLVTGGRTQRDWEHGVPKVAHAGPRISLAFRHGLDRRAYRA